MLDLLVVGGVVGTPHQSQYYGTLVEDPSTASTAAELLQPLAVDRAETVENSPMSPTAAFSFFSCVYCIVIDCEAPEEKRTSVARIRPRR